MANTGDICSVGTSAPDSGRYKHSVCSNTEIFNKNDILPRCANPTCQQKGADWILQRKVVNAPHA